MDLPAPLGPPMTITWGWGMYRFHAIGAVHLAEGASLFRPTLADPAFVDSTARVVRVLFPFARQSFLPTV